MNVILLGIRLLFFLYCLFKLLIAFIHEENHARFLTYYILLLISIFLFFIEVII